MPEINCQNCDAACCRANMMVELSIEETSFMLRGGNRFITVAQPVDYDREEVLYPVGHETDEETGEFSFLIEPGREYEPLAAGLGRYITKDDCTYLEQGDDGGRYCGVYDERPDVCRGFEMGGEKCQKMRSIHNIGALSAGSVTPVVISETR